MSEKKPFIVHTYRDNQFLYSETFSSRKEMADHLRSLGVRFTNSEICNMGSSSKIVRLGRFAYEIEELINVNLELVHKGGKYITLAEYCRRTGKKVDSVRYEYKHGRLKGLTVGKRNYVYIFWESL